MAYIWFNSVLEALGKRINYESISNIYGNSFAKDASKYVQAANPLIKTNNSTTNVMSLAGSIKIIENKTMEEGTKIAQTDLGDLSWAGDLFK